MTASLASAFAELRADYEFVRGSSLLRTRTGLAPGGAGADWHYRSEADYLRGIEIARDMDRNDLLIGQGVDRVVDQVLQSGVSPDPQTGDAETDDLLLAAWNEWAGDPWACHSEGRLTWRQLERLVFRAAFLVDGDHFLLPTDTGALWSVEAHRVRTPSGTRRRVIHGIKLNGQDQPEELWVTKQDLEPSRPLRRVQEIQAFPWVDPAGRPLVWQIVDPKRTSQRRGVTRFAPMARAGSYLDDTLFATLVKQQVASCIAFLRERQPDVLPGPPGTLGETELRELSAGTTRLLEHVFPGMEVVGKPGEKLHGFTPNIATSDSMAFSLLILSILAVNLGIPVAVLLLDPSNTNFSGWRGAIDQARVSFKRLVQDYIQQLHVRAWKFRVTVLLQEPSERGDQVRSAAARIGPAIFRHRWNAQSYGYIEPLKDAAADALRLDKLLTSPRRVWAEKGADWFTGVDEIVEDHSYAIEQAVLARRRLIDRYQGHPDAQVFERLHWREFLRLTGTDPLARDLLAADETQEGAPA
jgi:capsid protein